MNERIRELAEHCDFYVGNEHHDKSYEEQERLWVEKFAELIVRECANICMEMYAKCAGLPGDGALAKDCAYWIKKDFGVE
jgi:hypothetical protein